MVIYVKFFLDIACQKLLISANFCMELFKKTRNMEQSRT